MKKNFCLLLIFTLLSGCFGSVAFLGPASTTAASGASGNMARGAFTSTVSYGIKKTTGKFPIEHAVLHEEQKNSIKKEEPCLSFVVKFYQGLEDVLYSAPGSGGLGYDARLPLQPVSSHQPLTLHPSPFTPHPSP